MALHSNQLERQGKPHGQLLFPGIFTGRVLGMLRACGALQLLSAAQGQGIARGTSRFWSGICQMQVGLCSSGLGWSLAASEGRAEDLATHMQKILRIFFLMG